MNHPCLRCGACCAAFRVAFHWSEAQPAAPDGVPAALAEPLRRHELAMRHDAAMRCVALAGIRIGLTLDGGNVIVTPGGRNAGMVALDKPNGSVT